MCANISQSEMAHDEDTFMQDPSHELDEKLWYKYWSLPLTRHHS